MCRLGTLLALRGSSKASFVLKCGQDTYLSLLQTLAAANTSDLCYACSHMTQLQSHAQEALTCLSFMPAKIHACILSSWPSIQQQRLCFISVQASVNMHMLTAVLYLCSNTNSANCALGTDRGTSMSTPVVAGAVALVRQYFVQGWYPTGAAVTADAYTPSGALLKAVVLGAVPSLLRPAVDPTDPGLHVVHQPFKACSL